MICHKCKLDITPGDCQLDLGEEAGEVMASLSIDCPKCRMSYYGVIQIEITEEGDIILKLYA